MCIYTKKKKSTNIITLPKILTEILENLIGAGLKPVLVGGCIRDFYLDITCKDYDIEVYGIDDLVDLELNLEQFGTVVLAGKSFGVLKLSCEGYEFDFALPRTEIKTGSGHQGFEVQTNGQLDFKEAARRRDFTINAMGYDYTSKTLLDPYNGKKDIKSKVLRHIDDTTFVEDPLRVYRAVQFAARFEFSLDKRTFTLCQDIVSKNQLEELAKERVFEEIKKLLLRAKRPSLGFTLIKDLGILKYFPQLEVLIGCLQEKEYHPEGDVWIHTLMCLDEMAKLRSNDEYRNLYLMLAVLCHDLGKPSTSTIINGKITSHNHEKEGLEPTIKFIQLLSNEKKLLEKILPLVQHHLAPFQLYLQNSSLKAVKRLATKVNIEDLCIVCLADCKGRTIPNKEKCDHAIKWLLDNAKEAKVHKEKMKALVMGIDLIGLGFKPSPLFSTILAYAYDLQIEHENHSKEKLLDLILKNFQIN